MKKIAILTINSIILSENGGAEKFNLNLLNSISSCHDMIFNVFPYFLKTEIRNGKISEKTDLSQIINNKRLNVLLKGKKIHNFLEKIIHEYDYIIISGGYFYSKSLFKANNVIFIALLEYKAFKYYNQFHGWKKVLFNSISTIFGLKSRIFNPYDKNFKHFFAFPMNLKFSKARNVHRFFLSGPKKFEKQYEYSQWSSRPNDISYIGRLENTQKNIKQIPNIAKILRKKIMVYGSGPDNKLLQNKQNVILNGALSFNKIKMAYIDAKYTILTSNYEGHPYSIIESIFYGAIPIMNDNFSASKYYKKYFSDLVNFYNNHELTTISKFMKNESIQKYNKFLAERERFIHVVNNEYKQFINNIISIINCEN